MKIEICNLRQQQPSEPYDFYIDRRSSLGNPYFIGSRKKVIKLYKKWFKLQVKKDSWCSANKELTLIKKALKKYGKVRLFCWCSPKKCHGDIIKKWLIK